MVLSGIAVVALVLRVLDVLSSPELSRLGAATDMAAGIAVLCRSAAHYSGGYWNHTGTVAAWRDSHRRRLNALLVGQIAIGLGLTAGGLVFLVGAPRYWTALALNAIAWPALWFIVDRELTLAGIAGLSSGTRVVLDSRRITAARGNIKQRLSFERVDRWDEAIFADGRAATAFSVLVLGCFLLIAASGSAQVAAVAPSVVEWMGRDGEGQSSDEPDGQGDTGLSLGSEPTVDSDPGSDDATATDVPRSGPNRCPIEAGEGIRDPAQRDAAKDAWAEAGEPTYGCPERAVRVPGTQAVYTVRGVCATDGTVRALAVVGAGHRAAVLLANPVAPVDPVRVAQELAAAGQLRGASPRTRLGTGDFQILFTEAGTRLLVRMELSKGAGGIESEPQNCGEVRPGGGEYVELPPALAHQWLQAGAALRPSWPARDRSRDAAGRVAYSLVGLDGQLVATADCWVEAPHRCRLEAPGLILDADDSTADPVSADLVRLHGPAQP